ncbi:WYL domain-containing protein [Limosilactobacillus fermentum]|nr:WYL domain-containing protein [Limosilactobacillus fermentum]
MTRPLNQLQLAEHGANEINTLLKGERHYYRPVAEPTQLAVLETFLDAVYAHKKVIVDYRKRDGSIDKDYVFTPLSIEQFDYYWYVRGYKEFDTTKGAKGDEADAARILRCDGVLSIKIGPDATKRELEGFEADRNTVIGMLKGKNHQTQTILVKADHKAAEITIDRINAEVVGYYVDQTEFPASSLAEVPDDAPVKLKSRLMLGAGLYLLLGISGIEVLEPKELRLEIIKKLSDTLARYQLD